MIDYRVFFFAFLLFLSACSRDADQVTPDPPDDGTEMPAEEEYSVKEDFEGAEKKAYAAGDVKLRTGYWSFDEALLGDLDADVKNGGLSVRMRETARISANFDIQNLEKVVISHATYGNDGPGSWQLYVAEKGKGYEPVGSVITTSSHLLKPDTIPVEAEGTVRIRIVKSGNGRINIDDVIFIGKGESGIVIGEPDQGGDNEDPAPGEEEETPRGVIKGDDAPPANGDNSNLLFGNPSNASGVAMVNNYLINNYYYTLSYSRDRGIPNWVSWHVDQSNITGETDRQDNFAAFSGLPGGWYQVSHSSYTGSGFNRGHNCPSADRTSSFNANSATFLMVNMIPQAPQNNQGPWTELENDIRDEVRTGKEAYIIMGSYGEGGDGDKGAKSIIDDGRITVPAYIWKIAVIMTKGDGDLARVNAETEVIAINMPNSNSVNMDWSNYRVSVRDIEKKTGYDLLSSLPENIQDIIEEKAF